MRIGDLSAVTGTTPRLLRYYEEQGLIAPERMPSGYRVYADSDVDAVRRIRQLLDAGLSTATIADVLPCVRADGSALTPTCPQTTARIRAERNRLSKAIDEMRRSRALLDAVLAGGEYPESPAEEG